MPTMREIFFKKGSQLSHYSLVRLKTDEKSSLDLVVLI